MQKTNPEKPGNTRENPGKHAKPQRVSASKTQKIPSRPYKKRKRSGGVSSGMGASAGGGEQGGDLLGEALRHGAPGARGCALDSAAASAFAQVVVFQ